jgi:tetratricopeptide (TPR) repeat protein
MSFINYLSLHKELCTQLFNKSSFYRLIGRSYFLTGEYDKALECAQQSISIDPNSTITQFLLFEIYLQQNKDREGNPT